MAGGMVSSSVRCVGGWFSDLREASLGAKGEVQTRVHVMRDETHEQEAGDVAHVTSGGSDSSFSLVSSFSFLFTVSPLSRLEMD